MAHEWYCPATKLISDKKVLRALSLNIYSFNQINTGLRDTIITHKRKGKGKFLFGGLLIQEFWNPSGTSSFVRGTHLKEGVEKDKEKKKTISKRWRLTTMSTFLFSFGNVEKIKQHRRSSQRGSCSQLWPRLLFNMSSFLFSKNWKERRELTYFGVNIYESSRECKIGWISIASHVAEEAWHMRSICHVSNFQIASTWCLIRKRPFWQDSGGKVGIEIFKSWITSDKRSPSGLSKMLHLKEIPRFKDSAYF